MAAWSQVYPRYVLALPEKEYVFSTSSVPLSSVNDGAQLTAAVPAQNTMQPGSTQAGKNQVVPSPKQSWGDCLCDTLGHSCNCCLWTLSAALGGR